MDAKPEQLGKLIERARKAAGLSARGAADEAGISEGRWRQIEKGRQPIGDGQSIPVRTKLSTLRAICDVVGVDIFEAAALAGFPPAEISTLPDPRGEDRLSDGSVDLTGLLAEDIGVLNVVADRLRLLQGGGVDSGEELINRSGFDGSVVAEREQLRNKRPTPRRQARRKAQ